MIQTEALTKRLGGRTVVSDVTFRCEPGTVTGLLGLNGAGKTTTMRIPEKPLRHPAMNEHNVGEMISMLAGGTWTAAEGHIGDAGAQKGGPPASDRAAKRTKAKGRGHASGPQRKR